MCLSFPAAADVTVTSPDGHVQFLLSTGAQRHLEYTVTFNSKNIIDRSPLGIVVDKVDLADRARIGTAPTYAVNETYPWYGPHSTATDNCNQSENAHNRPIRAARPDRRRYTSNSGRSTFRAGSPYKIPRPNVPT